MNAADQLDRIIRNYYRTEKDSLQRPLVFGMTASPVDSNTDFAQAVFELEKLLDSKIITTADMSLVDAVNRPSEQLIRYAPALVADYQSPFLLSLKQICNDQDAFQGILRRASEISRHLGHWCADRYLCDVIHPDNEDELVRTAKKRFHGMTSALESSSAEPDVTKMVQDIIEYVQSQKTDISHKNTEALRKSYAEENLSELMIGTTTTTNIMSRKVARLLQYVTPEFARHNEQRCIIFVDWKQTARLLCQLVTEIGINNLRPGFVTGSGKNDKLDRSTFSLRSQVLSLTHLRSGEVNCMFATSVAEEGLDIPSCNLVIRFSIYKTMIAYVQSKGRARKRNSKYVHMLEEGNHSEKFLAQKVIRGEHTMRQHCANLLPDRQLNGNIDPERLLDDAIDLDIHIEESTGARLTIGNAMAVLEHFVSAVPCSSDSRLSQCPTYAVFARGGRFQAEVILPGNSPICSATGKPQTKKQLARRSAAFEACMQLRKKAYLNEFFMPIYQKKLPAMRNAKLATGLSKGKSYPMRSKPSLWAETRGSVPDKLWATLIDLVDGELERPHRRLLFLTRTQQVNFPHFPIFLSNGQSVMVKSTNLGDRKPLDVSEHMTTKLTQFTLVIFNDVFSKEYLEEPEKMSYWLCPVNEGVTTEGATHILPGNIDHETLDEVVRNRKGYQWTAIMPTTFLLEKFVVDPWDGRRKFFTTREVRHDLTPDHPIPKDGVSKKDAKSILEFSLSPFKKSSGRAQLATTQPVIVAELSPYTLRRNLLAKPEAKEMTNKKLTKAYICPEPLRISAIPSDLAATCFLWPAIIHRFESCLISLEGISVVGVDCSPELALMAFTKDSDSSGDHDADEPVTVNISSGMGENYERLEWLGDTFLKVATSMSVYIMNPDENEFEFHVRRMLMLCNKNLFNRASDDHLKLYEYVRSKAFSRRIWYPEGLSLVRGTGVKTGDAPKPMFHGPEKHDLSQKSIADVSEALIGAAFLHARRPGRWTSQQFDNAVQTVTKLVGSQDHTMVRWEDYMATYLKAIPSYQIGHVTAVQKDLATKLEKEHPYCFRYPRLAQVAFVHPSLPFTHIQLPNYQRLEFLGDALFDLAAVTFLFDRFPDKDPHFLTESKMCIVNNRFLGALCVKLGFHRHIRHHHSELQGQISDYAVLLAEAHSEAQRLAQEQDQPHRLRDYWTTVQDPPKCLADVLESFCGAMFIDSGFDYNVIQDFFDRHVKFFFEDMSLYDGFANNHPVTRMTDILQNQLGCSDFRILLRDYAGGEDGREKTLAAALMVHDRIVEGTATTGTSGRYARVRVAKQAGEIFEGMSPVDFKARWACTCSSRGTQAE
jgi:endoribonuclease Dicer